jgi:S-adenosylmethionine:tRNA ribosyltransferase-isomerase
VSEDIFTSLPKYIEKGELMIFNNTKVIQARLHFRKETGALIEIFCLEPIEPADYAMNFQQTTTFGMALPDRQPEEMEGG